MERKHSHLPSCELLRRGKTGKKDRERTSEARVHIVLSLELMFFGQFVIESQCVSVSVVCRSNRKSIAAKIEAVTNIKVVRQWSLSQQASCHRIE